MDPLDRSGDAMAIRVLLVDDDPELRESVSLLLGNLGFVVTAAADGRIALRLASERDFDVVVADIFMPECDGLELVEELHRTRPSLPVVAISGGGHFHDFTE